MAITVQFKSHRRQWEPRITYETDIDTADSIIFDYSGELGSDTISTATATTKDVTAGTPSISSNVVTVALSGFSKDKGKMEMQITTAGGITRSNLVRFRIKDYYNDY